MWAGGYWKSKVGYVTRASIGSVYWCAHPIKYFSTEKQLGVGDGASIE